MIILRKYSIDDRYRYLSKSQSDGEQDKFYRNGYYYKLNKVGNEGYVEHLVSVLLSCTDLYKDDYVYYEYCRINSKLGCRCKDFVNNGGQFLTASKIYERYIGSDSLSEKIAGLGNATARLKFLIDLYSLVGIDKRVALSYFRKIFLLDYVIVNTDRHVRNIGVVNYGGRYSPAPIFDNGCALDTNRMGVATSCTISGSFSEQLIATGYPIQPIFRVNTKLLMQKLANEPNLYEKAMLIGRLKTAINEGLI